MIVTLDCQRVNDSLATDSTLLALIDQVRAGLDSERLIVSVTIDGQRIPDADLGAKLEQPIAGYAQIDLESGDRHQLVRDALRGLAHEFDLAGAQLPGIAERLGTTDVAAAIRDIGGFVGLWQTCNRIITQCSGLLGKDLTLLEHEARPVCAWLDDLIEKLTCLRGALDAHDTVLLADIVRYEFPTLATTWQALLSNLAAQVAARQIPA